MSTGRNREATTRIWFQILRILQEFELAISIAAWRLNECRRYARNSIVYNPLTRTSKGAFVNWCRCHIQWKPENWSRVLFTYESRYSLNPDSTCVQEEGIVSNLALPCPWNIPCLGPRLMVLKGFMTNGSIELYIFQGGSITTRRHMEKVSKFKLDSLEVLLALSFCYWMIMLGHIEHIWCQKTCKQNVSFEWIASLIAQFEPNWAWVGCFSASTFSAANPCQDPPCAQKYTFWRVACNFTRFYQWIGKVYETKKWGIFICLI